mgnify:CR=1 FL=1
MEFDIKLKSQDMYRFNMYQTYTGFHGWFSIIVSIIIFVVAGLITEDWKSHTPFCILHLVLFSYSICR